MADTALTVPVLSPEELEQVLPILTEVYQGLSQQRNDAVALVGKICSDRQLFEALRKLATHFRNHRTIIHVDS